MLLNLTSSCGNAQLATRAELSLDSVQVGPSSYLVAVCENDTEISISRFGFVDALVAIQSPLTEALEVEMNCSGRRDLLSWKQ